MRASVQATICPPGATGGLERWLRTALFDLDSPLGRRTNFIGIGVIMLTVALAMIGTLETLSDSTRWWVQAAELVITLGFAVEYVLRVFVARPRRAYVLSFYGIIDLLSWAPLLLIGDTTVAIRLLRVLRLLKLIRYLRPLHQLLSRMGDALDIVLTAIFAIVIVVVIAGNLIHALELAFFGNAFVGSWWALVTMTTVGYGDLVPFTPGGKMVAMGLMMTGITMFAMLTGAISVKIAHLLSTNSRCAGCGHPIPGEVDYCPLCGARHERETTVPCATCRRELEPGDRFCYHCGARCECGGGARERPARLVSSP